MSKWIDADALKEKYTMVIKRYKGGIMERPAVLLETIDDAPSIDIVRCFECKHNPWYYNPEEPLDYTCVWNDDFADREQTRDDFCSYGERKVE